MKTRVRFPLCPACRRYRERQAGFDCCASCAYALAQRVHTGKPTVGDGAYLNRMMTTGTAAPVDVLPMVRK